MRRDSGGTPQTKTKSQAQKSSATKTNSNGKKLVQARLPFKTLAPAPGGDDDVAIITDEEQKPNEGTKRANRDSVGTADVRKRKLSYESDEATTATTESKEPRGHDIDSKENVELPSGAPKKKKIGHIVDESDTIILDDELTNESENAQEHPAKPKVLVKFPFNSAKGKKRRKAVLHKPSEDAKSETADSAVSSDDVAEHSQKLNPQKRPKIDERPANRVPEEQNPDVIELGSDSDSETANPTHLPAKSRPAKGGAATQPQQKSTNSKRKHSAPKKVPTPGATSTKTSESAIASSFFKQKLLSPKKPKAIAEIEEVKAKSSEQVEPPANLSESVPKKSATPKPAEMSTKQSADEVSCDDDNDPDSSIHSLSSSAGTPAVADHVEPAAKPSRTKAQGEEQQKPLTPKQIKINEQRKKAREEKERKLQEERLQKQREKEEKELVRKREREEKERKRLAELEAKNEEKRKRNEVKEEELRKKEDERKRKEMEKEDERKRKEMEKEEAEHKKKKAAEGFKRFFVAKESRASVGGSENDPAKPDEAVLATDSLAFRPFQLRGDMRLAPICRKMFSTEAKRKLDSLVRQPRSDDDDSDDDAAEIVRRKPLAKNMLYLAELRNGNIVPGRSRKPSVTAKEVDAEDDVCIVDDELERAGQAIVEETHGPLERFRAKFFKFTENRRPPYFGTWRKCTSVITPRHPFAQDKKFFDYEVDSDLEWEEEEPGESLDGSEDEKEKESEDDEYEVDNEWFVPHGHLSDEEMQNEDECGLDNGTGREAQKAKLKLLQQEFAQEMKKKTEKLKPRLIGCIWVDENGNQPAMCPRIIWDSLAKRAMLCTAPPQIEDHEEVAAEKADSGSPSASTATAEKIKPIILTESILLDLVRLLHGNSHSKVFLINEFIAHVEANEESIRNGDVRCPLKSTVREKIDEFAEWNAYETDDNKAKNKKKKKRMCWMVSAEVLQRMNLSDLSVTNNAWEYKLQPKSKTADLVVNKLRQTENGGGGSGAEDEDKVASANTTNESKLTAKPLGGIGKFTKVLTATEMAAKLVLASPKTGANKPDVVEAESPADTAASMPATTMAAAAVKKRVPLLMSVARGQQFSPSTKSALISQFLSTGKTDPLKQSCNSENAAKHPRESNDEVILLD